MLCPNCGAPMNRHAEKPLKGAVDADFPKSDAGLHEMIAVIHSCPACGKIEAVVEPLHD